MFELFFHAITDGNRQAVECHHRPSFAFPFGRGNYKETVVNEKLKEITEWPFRSFDTIWSFALCSISSKSPRLSNEPNK